MKRQLGAVILLVSTLPSAHSQRLEQPQLVQILSCIQQIGPKIGAPLPHFDSEHIRFRYHAGVVPLRYPSGQVVSQGTQDEVRMAVYGPHESFLIIYDLFLTTKKDGSVAVEIGNPASFVKSDDRWIAGDNPGGMATDLLLRTLVKEFSVQAPHIMGLSDLATSRQCNSCTR